MPGSRQQKWKEADGGHEPRRAAVAVVVNLDEVRHARTAALNSVQINQFVKGQPRCQT
jgi:hypothetical protein